MSDKIKDEIEKYLKEKEIHEEYIASLYRKDEDAQPLVFTDEDGDVFIIE